MACSSVVFRLEPDSIWGSFDFWMVIGYLRYSFTGESKIYDTALTKAYTNHQMSNFYWYKFPMPSQDHAKSFLNCTNNLFNQTFLLPTYHPICYLHRLNSEEIYKMCVLKRKKATPQKYFQKFWSSMEGYIVLTTASNLWHKTWPISVLLATPYFVSKQHALQIWNISDTTRTNLR